MTLPTIPEEMARLSGLLDAGLKSMRQYAREYADAEHAYREAKGLAWLQAPEGTVPEREAWVNRHTKDQRRQRDLAADMKQAALEAVRSRRGQISALQTVINADREEMAFSRTGPQGLVA